MGEAGYGALRLPFDVRDLVAEWPRAYFPDKLKHVMSLMRAVRGGKLNDPRFEAPRV